MISKLGTGPRLALNSQLWPRLSVCWDDKHAPPHAAQLQHSDHEYSFAPVLFAKRKLFSLNDLGSSAENLLSLNARGYFWILASVLLFCSSILMHDSLYLFI